MNIKNSPQVILEKISAIEKMERGTLSITRQGPNGPYYNLQSWYDGRNHTEYVPAGQLEQVQQHIEAHQQFVSLVGEYERIITEQTRQERLDGLKK